MGDDTLHPDNEWILDGGERFGYQLAEVIEQLNHRVPGKVYGEIMDLASLLDNLGIESTDELAELLGAELDDTLENVYRWPDVTARQKLWDMREEAIQSVKNRNTQEKKTDRRRAVEATKKKRS